MTVIRTLPLIIRVRAQVVKTSATTNDSPFQGYTQLNVHTTLSHVASRVEPLTEGPSYGTTSKNHNYYSNR